MKSRLNIFLMLTLLTLTQICHPARSSQSGSSARGGAPTPTIIPSTALPGGQNIATSLSTLSANVAAKKPAGPLLDKYLKNLRCVQAKSFLEAIAASPETQLFDNAGTPVRELYINDPNPDAYTEISTPKTSSQQTLQNTSKIAPVKPAVTISNSNRGGTRAR